MRSLVLLHSHLDKVAKSMRKEDAPYVKLQSNRFNQPERRRWKDHHGGQSGRGSGTAGQKVLLIDADAQANLTMSLGYSRPDDLPDTLSTIMQDIIDDKPVDVSRKHPAP